MQPDYWHKQNPQEPLFPDLLWSRPENKQFAGKLGIIGGHAQSFARPAEAFGVAEQSGIGVVRVLLPDSLHKTVGRVFPAGEYAPSTPSGSFASQSLSDALELGAWSDGLLLAGDLGRNSETAIMLESLASKYRGRLTVTCDAADYYITTPQPLLSRPESLLVISFAQLQKLARSAHYPKAFTFEMDLLRLIDQLHDFAEHYALNLIVKHLDTVVIAAGGQVSTTKQSSDQPVWRLKAAAKAAVWWLQNPDKPFQALTTSIVVHK